MSSSGPPEFFFDRSLGRRTARGLRDLGWVIHLVADFYLEDADRVDDIEWIAEGCARGWSLLTKDKRIRYRRDEIGALNGHLFSLSSGNLTVAQAVDRFRHAAPRVEHAIAVESPGFWLIYDGGRIERKWP